MAIKAELTRNGGPGYGVLRISGLRGDKTGLRFSLRRNQSAEPYLGDQGGWQATEAWLVPSRFDAHEDGVAIPVGPNVIDAIVALPPSAAYQLGVIAGESAPQTATLKVSRALLGSGAAGSPQSERTTLPLSTTSPATAPARSEPAAPEPISPVVPVTEERGVEKIAPVGESPAGAPRRRLTPLFAVAALLVLGGGAAAAWYRCLVPGIGPAHCESQPPEDGDPTDCTGLGGDDCFALAVRVVERGELVPGRDLLQQAATLGSVEANLRLARMYDPDHWSADTSPAPEPDWQTAAYWYEHAAEKGNAEGMIGAGKLPCQHATTSFERKQGLDYLRRAKEAGAADAEAWIQECEKKGG